jgi:hypothetical protein
LVVRGANMSKNIDQVFIANPITSNASTDLMYFGQSPYGAGNDAAMTYANFSAQFGAPYTAAALTSGNDTNVTLTLGGTPATALLHAASITAGWTGQLSVARGGTGVSSVTIAPTATAWAGWDANKNFSANSFIAGYRTTATAAATTTLTVSDAYQQYFTGSTTQTVLMPVTSTLVLGQQYFINNLSSGVVTVQSSGGNTIQAMAANTTLTLTCILTSGTTAASWNAEYVLDSALTLPLSLANGGTNAALTANNGGIVWSNATQLQILNGTSTANQVLLSGNAATPAWSTATYPATTTINQILYSSSANTITGLATANSAVLVTNSSGVPAFSGTMTNGQVIIGSTTSTPTAATLTAGTGISITNGAGSITIAGTTNALTYNDVSGTSQAAVVNNGYVISNSAQTTVTLPATAAEGSRVAVQGKGAAGWILAANTGQTIHLGSSASSVAGSLTSTNLWDTVTVVCVTANTTWAASSVIGNLTVA